MKKSDYLPIGTQVLYEEEPGWEIVVNDYSLTTYRILNRNTGESKWVSEKDITRAPVTLDTLIEGDVLIADRDRIIVIQGRIGDVYVAIDSEDEGIFYTTRELEEYGYEVIHPGNEEKITLTSAEAETRLKEIDGKEVEITD